MREAVLYLVYLSVGSAGAFGGYSCQRHLYLACEHAVVFHKVVKLDGRGKFLLLLGIGHGMV